MSQLKSLDDYFTGKRFNNGLSIKWEFGKRELFSRIQFLTEVCRDKNIIHLGCLDHNKETITRKLTNNIWLHKKLIDISNCCLGIDINQSLIKEIRTEMDIDNIICSDISTDILRTEITSRYWDYLICGEVLEHIDNPILFLSSIREKYAKYISKIIVTVPNTLNLSHIKRAFKGVESINTDHRYSFTPYNISKVLINSGYKVSKINMALHFDPKTRGPIHRFILGKFPLLRSDIIITAGF